MFETLQRLWREEKLTEAMLDNAVTKSWITTEEKQQIIAQ